jgi:hypothetical protein
MMNRKDFEPQIGAGLSVVVGKITLIAVVDNATKTIKIEQRGTVTDEPASAIEEGRRQLIGRIERVRPKFKIVG